MKNLLVSLFAMVGTIASANAQQQPSTNSPVTWDNIHLRTQTNNAAAATTNAPVTWDNIHLQPKQQSQLTNNAAVTWDNIHLQSRQQPVPQQSRGGGWDTGNGWHRNYLGGLISIQGVLILNTQQRSGPNWMLVPTYPGQVIQFGGFGGGSGGSGSWDNVSPRQAPNAAAPGGWDNMGKK
ncbi:MAG: hypothetical protein HYY10_03370 [Candidatus Liptonbacteria bacterium]|nr:hypothetical protein [Candidatus Liptonbacteria bacterium]